jgi:hypothetical protein
VSNLFDLINSLADLDAVITSGQRESETLEYKDASKRLGGDALNEVVKDISAFANSLGGLLVYGVETADKTQPGLPTGRTPIEPANIAIIQRAAASGIRHPVAGLRYKELPPNGTPEALLVDVPQSALAPHQAVTHYRYYRRNGPHSDPMAHDLVELYFGRRLGPIVRPSFELDSRVSVRRGDWIGDFRLDVPIHNEGARLARHMLLAVRFPLAAVSDLQTGPLGYGSREVQRFSELTLNFGTDVLHPGRSSRRFAVGFKMSTSEIAAGRATFRATVYADEMAQQQAGIRVVLIGDAYGVEPAE